MGKTVIKCNLSTDSIQKAIQDLEKYKQDLNRKIEIFTKKLAQRGVEVARHESGKYGKYLSFTVETENTNDGYKAVLVATNTGIIRSEWRTKEGVKSADVSPLLMAEFGAGLLAENPKNIPDVGAGTFPGGSHGKDPEGWWWMDLDGNWHHSYGVTPKQPMYKASMEIIRVVNEVRKEVFG